MLPPSPRLLLLLVLSLLLALTTTSECSAQTFEPTPHPSRSPTRVTSAPVVPSSFNGIKIEMALMVGIPAGMFGLALLLSIVFCIRGGNSVPGEPMDPATASGCMGCCCSGVGTTQMIKLRKLSVAVGFLSVTIMASDWVLFVSAFVYIPLVVLLVVCIITYNSTGPGFAKSCTVRYVRTIRMIGYVSIILLVAGLVAAIGQLVTMFPIYFIFVLFLPFLGLYIVVAIIGMVVLALVLMDYNASLLVAVHAAGGDVGGHGGVVIAQAGAVPVATVVVVASGQGPMDPADVDLERAIELSKQQQ